MNVELKRIRAQIIRRETAALLGRVREAAALSTEDLAAQVKSITVTQIRAYEDGEVDIPASHFFALITACGATAVIMDELRARLREFGFDLFPGDV